MDKLRFEPECPNNTIFDVNHLGQVNQVVPANSLSMSPYYSPSTSQPQHLNHFCSHYSWNVNFLWSNHRYLLSVPGKCQVLTCLKAFTRVVSCAWNAWCPTLPTPIHTRSGLHVFETGQHEQILLSLILLDEIMKLNF